MAAEAAKAAPSASRWTAFGGGGGPRDAGRRPRHARACSPTSTAETCSAMPRLLRHVFGAEQYACVKAALAGDDGRTSLAAMSDFLSKVFAAIGDEAKN